MNTLLKLPMLIGERYPRSRSSLYEDIRLGIFVPPIKLGARAVAWLSEEVETLKVARTAGVTTEQVRSVVRQLIEARKSSDPVAQRQTIMAKCLGGSI